MNYDIIHIVLGRANPNRMNGVNKVVYNLATFQTELGKKVCVLGITNSYDKKPEYEAEYETSFVPPGRSPWAISVELKTFVRAHKGAVYHLHGAFIPAFFRLHKILVKQKTSFVFTPHGSYTKGAMSQSAFKKKVFFRLFESPMLKRAKTVQVLGHVEHFDTQSLAKRAVLKLIPNGQVSIDVESSFSEELIFGYCGRITRFQKGLDLLINGFIDYKTHGGKGVLWIIGDGEYSGEMKSIATAAGVLDSVKFHGAVYGSEKDELMKQLTAFLHPSRNEGLPTAVLESTALSVPIVVTKETSMDRYTTQYKAGWVIKELSGKAVSDALMKIEKVWLGGGIDCFRKNAFQLYDKEFNWKKIANDLITVYES